MPLNIQEACKFLDLFLNDQEAWNTTKKSLTGAGITAVSAFIGALLLGPPGLALGGTLGGVTSFAYYSDDFRPLMEVWNNMSQQQRTELAQQFNKAFRFQATDALYVMLLLKDNQALVDNIKNFLRENLRPRSTDNPSLL